MDTELQKSIDQLDKIDNSILNFSKKQIDIDIKDQSRFYYRKINKNLKYIKKLIMALNLENENLIKRKIKIKAEQEARLARMMRK